MFSNGRTAQFTYPSLLCKKRNQYKKSRELTVFADTFKSIRSDCHPHFLLSCSHSYMYRCFFFLVQCAIHMRSEKLSEVIQPLKWSKEDKIVIGKFLNRAINILKFFLYIIRYSTSNIAQYTKNRCKVINEKRFRLKKKVPKMLPAYSKIKTNVPNFNSLSPSMADGPLAHGFSDDESIARLGLKLILNHQIYIL